MTAFDRMRADLVQRGLIDAGHRLTPAGNAHALALMASLAAAAPKPPPETAVRWNTSRGSIRS